MIFSPYRIKKYNNGGGTPSPVYYRPNVEDVGYYYDPSWAKVGDVNYRGKVFPTGISRIGSGASGGAEYDPVSDASINNFFDNINTFGSVDNRFSQLGSHRDYVLSLKDPRQRLRVMNELQGQRQKLIYDVFPEQMTYAAVNYGGTQQGLQAVINGLNPKDRAEFTRELKNLGWGVNGNTVVRGNYGFQSDPEATRTLVANYLSKPEYEGLKQSFVNGQVLDGAWDRRNETYHTPDFYSEADYNKFITDNNLKGFSNGYVDPNNPNNIINPRLFRTKIVDEATYNAWKDKKKDYGDYTLEDGSTNKYIRYMTKGMSNEPKDPPGGDDKGSGSSTDLKAYEGKVDNVSWLNAMPMLTPTANRIPPQLFQPGLKSIGHYQANPLAVSPESAIRELDRQYSTATRMAYENNPYTANAMNANLMAQRATAVNQAYANANLTNQQDARNVENINEQRMLGRDTVNVQTKQLYEDKSNQALDNFVKSWRGYYDTKNLEQTNKYNLNNQRIALNAVNQDFTIGPFGQIIQTGNPNFVISGRYEIDPKTGKHYVRDANGKYKEVTTADEKSTKTKESKKYGGFLRNGGRIKRIF